ncbi:hypothetical protein C8Q78DRAFT_1010612 [Trametes maxima]|nr:hypothetical protein C8Q78DRAFT_1010612 [Trametes maxima]
MFRLLSRSNSASPVPKSQELVGELAQPKDALSENGHTTVEPTSDTQVPEPKPSSPEHRPDTAVPSSSQQSLSLHDTAGSNAPTSTSQRRFSWRSLVTSKGVQDHKPALPPLREETAKEAVARQEYLERRMVLTRDQRRAHESALVVRDLIVGPFALPFAAPPKRAKVSASGATSLRKVQKVKTQLLQPKVAQRVISQLRALPTSDTPVVVGKTRSGQEAKALPKGPIHAVCLPYTDSEAHEKRFSKLDKVEATTSPSAPSKASPKAKEGNVDQSTVSGTPAEIASVTATSLEKLKEMLSDLNLVSLITAADLGLGQPAGGPGLFNGALPSADAIVNGVEQITPQLMALGYATGKAILPSHAGIYPPTDRMSVITYWWGLEVVMPEPSVKFLSNVPSIAHTVINFLTALSVANGGVRELMPFVRYISQYIDAEWHSIQQADQGQGVVCAATWIMPAALVPRPWDFPQPPVEPALTTALAESPEATETEGQEHDVPVPPASTPAQSSGSTATSIPSPTLLTPPLPDPNHASVFVAPPGDPAAQTESVLGNPEEGVPGVTVVPPTPPASETLGKAAGEGFQNAIVVAA